MKISLRLLGASFGIVLVSASFGQSLVANTTSNNGGSALWGMFFDVKATGTALNVTSLTSANTAAAGGAFSVEVFTRSGSALGGTVTTGVGSSLAGWTSLGIVNATQGATTNGISNLIDIPDIFVANGSTVGVALKFNTAGPRYFGTGTPPLQTFTDGTLTLVTGDARSAPFTTTGSYFTSRGLTGQLNYKAVPEPASMAALGLGLAAVLKRRKRK